MSTDFTKPLVSDAYATLLPGVQAAISDLARGLEPVLVGTLTNIPTGAIRWVAANSNWERYTGAAWVTLPTAGTNTYGINISGSAGSAGTATNLAGGLAGKIPYQSAAGTTLFSAAGTSGQAFLSGGAGAPTWGTLGIGAGGTGATTASSALAALGGAPLAGPTFTGVVTIPTGAFIADYAPLANPVFTGSMKETKSVMGASAIDLSAGALFTKTISGATTLTVTNVPAAGTVASFTLDLTNGGSAAITFGSGFTAMKWVGGTSPILTVAGRDILVFFTHDGGATWAGLVAGKDVK